MAAARRAFDGGELSPGPEVETDEQIIDWVARAAETALHPQGDPRNNAWDATTYVPDATTARAGG